MLTALLGGCTFGPFGQKTRLISSRGNAIHAENTRALFSVSQIQYSPTFYFTKGTEDLENMHDKWSHLESPRSSLIFNDSPPSVWLATSLKTVAHPASLLLPLILPLKISFQLAHFRFPGLGEDRRRQQKYNSQLGSNPSLWQGWLSEVSGFSFFHL